MKYYLLVIKEGSPNIRGPFSSDGQQCSVAAKIWPTLNPAIGDNIFPIYSTSSPILGEFKEGDDLTNHD